MPADRKTNEAHGALYLENNLTPRAFTPARVAVLELLASQAAISLENAKLYTDLHRNEASLRESEKTLRLIVDGIAGLVAIMTPEGEVEFVNNQVLKYFGKTLEKLKGWSSSDAVHPDDSPSSGPLPGGNRSKPEIPMTSTTVCAVLTVCTGGFTHVAYLCVTLKVASSVGITCLQTSTSG